MADDGAILAPPPTTVPDSNEPREGGGTRTGGATGRASHERRKCTPTERGP